MKIRSGFVSNSSSSSFIVACAEGYLEKILKDIAKSCEDRKSQYHDYGLVKRNFRILDFCVNTYQLLFLGTLLVRTEVKKWTFDDFKKRYDTIDCRDERMKKLMEDQAKHSWNDFKRHIDQAHKPGCEKWIEQHYGRDSYDELNDEITHFNDIMAERIVVSNSIMQSTFHRYHFTDADGNERPQSKEETDLRVSNIVEMARQQVGSTCHYNTSYSPDIYRITQDTIDNTRELIAAGHKLVFDDWEKLDVIEKMLKSGDAVFALRVARDGDGYGDFYIYTENDSGCIGNINGLETIGCMD